MELRRLPAIPPCGRGINSCTPNRESDSMTTMEQGGKGTGSLSPGAGEAPEVMPVAGYLKAARTELRSGRLREAYYVMSAACASYPDHPLILSYFGWLQAVVEKRPRSGVTYCRRAVANFRTADPQIAGTVYPVLYLNLGRTLLLSGRKKEAVDTFGKGLIYDRSHRDLRKEISALGIRKRPVFPFLSRSNPINKLFGKLRSGRTVH